MRNKWAERFFERRVLELNTFPPEILFPGASDNQDVKCLADGHRLMSTPHSPINCKARKGPIP